jgi:hypothetical protein
MRNYTVSIEIEPSAGYAFSPDLAQQLTLIGGVVRFSPHRIGATLPVDRAPNVNAAGARAVSNVTGILGQGEVVALEVTTVEEPDQRHVTYAEITPRSG